jgi:hypothetical protein
MNDAMFYSPSEKIDKLHITKEYAENKLEHANIQRLKSKLTVKNIKITNFSKIQITNNFQISR